MYYLYHDLVVDNITRIINKMPDSVYGLDIQWDEHTDTEDLILKQKVIHSRVIEGLFKHAL